MADKKTIVFRDETKGLDEVLQDIATSTIQNNWYGNRPRDFTKAELKQINKRTEREDEKFIDGCSYLSKKDGTRGGIRLYNQESCSPRWAFGYICKSCGLKAEAHSTDESVECGRLIKSLEVWWCGF